MTSEGDHFDGEKNRRRRNFDDIKLVSTGVVNSYLKWVDAKKYLKSICRLYGWDVSLKQSVLYMDKLAYYGWDDGGNALTWVEPTVEVRMQLIIAKLTEMSRLGNTKVGIFIKKANDSADEFAKYKDAGAKLIAQQKEAAVLKKSADEQKAKELAASRARRGSTTTTTTTSTTADTTEVKSDTDKQIAALQKQVADLMASVAAVTAIREKGGQLSSGSGGAMSAKLSTVNGR
jgi:hypothetical protein